METLAVSRQELAGSNQCLLVAEGYVDSLTTPILESALRECGRDGRVDVYLEMSLVSYVSSAGWGAMVTAIRDLRERGGDLKLVGMRGDVVDVFELLQFSSILESFPNLDAALAHRV